MDYLVSFEGQQEFLVSLMQTRRGQWTAKLAGGRSMNLELRGHGPDGELVIVVDGELRRFHLREEPGKGLVVEDDQGATPPVVVARAAEVALEGLVSEGAPKSAFSGALLASPITGIVVDVLVAQGQTVEPGEAVVVVEAMKMENTLKLSHGGRIADVCVRPGQTIHVNDALVRLS
jgi:biotin carboxyl carrier protein